MVNTKKIRSIGNLFNKTTKQRNQSMQLALQQRHSHGALRASNKKLHSIVRKNGTRDIQDDLRCVT
jgi:hypothetical protein